MVRKRSWPAVSHYHGVSRRILLQAATDLLISYNLQFHRLAIELDCPNLEVNADGRDEGRCPCVVAEA